jgi:hypothetical protein
MTSFVDGESESNRGLLAVWRSAGSRREYASGWCVLIHGSKAVILLKERYLSSDKPPLLERPVPGKSTSQLLILKSIQSVVHFRKGTVHSSFRRVLAFHNVPIQILLFSPLQNPVSDRETLMDVLALVDAAPL